MTEPGRQPPRPRIADAAAIVWLIALAALLTTALLTAFDYVDVRDAVTDSFAADHPATDRSDVAATVDAIMIGNAVVALLILAVAVVGVIRVRDRLHSGRTMLAVDAALAVVVGVQFCLVAEPVTEVVGEVISFLPLAMAGCAVIGSALLYAPAVGTWLEAAPPHHR
ncbi:hypothetical protein [Nocardia sp. 348MFTsu5.1]|uniref:hypothetical protein n=1 Tax=Nocardia sp. 348MFTsu5.1 TaxID=1172185 RepID=UPI00035C11C4|nr:hypothetical protein [Nocardia sp. 348MFTsu5.1]